MSYFAPSSSQFNFFTRVLDIFGTMFDVAGKIVIITGGATGIGYCYAKELLREGAQGICIADIDDSKGQAAIEDLNRKFGPNKAIFIRTDVTVPSQLEDACKKTIDTWQAIDVLINNAGILNDASWELEIAINCNAMVRGTLLGLQYMGRDKGGKGGIIVNISSSLGLQPLSGCPIYVATKHFILGLSRSFGTPYHYNRTGVKVITMCPALTHTSLVSEAPNCSLTALAPDITEQLTKEFAEIPGQSPEKVALGMITLLRNGENGSVWVAEYGNPIYEIEIPDRSTLKK